MSKTTTSPWTEETILEHLKEIVRDRLNLTPEQVAAMNWDDPLVEKLRLDSLGQVVLVTAVEDDFGCMFEPEEWQRVQTITDLVKMIAARVAPEPRR